MKTGLAQYLFLIFRLVSILAAAGKCPCADPKDCNHPKHDLGAKKEVFVFSNESVDVKDWNWDSLTTLIVPSSFDIANQTMCIAHSKGRKFGITVEMNISGPINATSDPAQSWIEYVNSQLKSWYAEIIAINLVPYFSADNQSFKQDHIELAKILSNLKKKRTEVTEIVKVACIVPWKPPCAENDDTCVFTEHSEDPCDYYVINPDSFTDLDDVKCRARANIPFSKLLYGISEYNSHHISNNKIILGVAWHGYDYTCIKLVDEICDLKNQEKSSKCNFSQRKKMPIGDILNKNVTKHEFNYLYNAPYFSYYEKADQHYHQVWFEDQTSLFAKYKLVTVLNLKGIGILYGEDLKVDTKISLTKLMWSWDAHEVLLKSSEKSVNDSFYYPDVISGVAVGCLILGAAFGIVFTCFGLKGRVKKPKQPFVRDMENGLNDYTDEDPNL